jgi:anti-anti-sigma factor
MVEENRNPGSLLSPGTTGAGVRENGQKEDLMLLTLSSRVAGNVYLIECTGRVVLGEEVKALEAAFAVGEREFTRFVVNLSGVSRLDSISMGLLARHAGRMRDLGGGLRLVAPPPFVESLLHMTKLSGLLQSYPTEEEAILSFLKEEPAEKAQERGGARVLVVDESANLCEFVRSVLMQRGFDVQTACRVRDARTLLQAEGVDTILVGPGNPHLPAETVMSTLQALAPQAAMLRLDPDFKIRDAREATNALLELFGLGGGF